MFLSSIADQHSNICLVAHYQSKNHEAALKAPDHEVDPEHLCAAKVDVDTVLVVILLLIGQVVACARLPQLGCIDVKMRHDILDEGEKRY